MTCVGSQRHSKKNVSVPMAHSSDNYHIKALPDRREIFAAVATTTISPKFRVDCGKEIRVVNHTSASVLW